MDLLLEMCNTRSVHWCGVSGRQLGKLSPSASLSIPLRLLSSVQGLQVHNSVSMGFSLDVLQIGQNLILEFRFSLAIFSHLACNVRGQS